MYSSFSQLMDDNKELFDYYVSIRHGDIDISFFDKPGHDILFDNYYKTFLKKKMEFIDLEMEFKQHKDRMKKNIEKNGEIYFVHYYTSFDRYNNGGIHTVLNDKQLKELLDLPNKINGLSLYFIQLWTGTSIINDNPTYPDWLDNKYKLQIDNPSDEWAKKILNS